MTVLIIEDEVKTARELKRLIESAAEGIVVADIIPSVKAGIKWLQNNEAPDLIISDIQLADGLSFDIYSAVTVTAPVIFCTAFDEYAIKAFEANGIDYLLKPVDEQRLKQALDKYAKIRAHIAADYEVRLQSLYVGMNKYRRTLLMHEGERILPVRVEQIAFMYFQGGAVTVTCADGKCYRLSATLEEMEKQLPPDEFFRANRQFIISRSVIQAAEHYFTRRLLVKLSVEPPEHVVISKVRSADFLKWWEQGA